MGEIEEHIPVASMSRRDSLRGDKKSYETKTEHVEQGPGSYREGCTEQEPSPAAALLASRLLLCG